MSMRKPSFRQLEAVTAVLETGSVTRAAVRLHISQPAISRLISTLEADVGYPLFRRAGGRILPTAEAELLREEIKNALTAVDRAGRRVQQLGNLAGGQLTVSAFPSLATTTLPQLLSRFRTEHPDIRITLNGVNNLHRILESVASQGADFAISNVPARASGVVAEHLCRYPAVCVVRPDHPFARLGVVPLADVARETFIALGKEDESQATVAQVFEQERLELDYPVEVALCASACAWVATAGGCSIVDPFTAGEWKGQLARVQTDPAIWFDLWVLRSEAKPLTRVASAFLATFSEHLLSQPQVSTERADAIARNTVVSSRRDA